jgi:transposase InsO family protein
LNRQFEVDRPNKVWTTDITYVWTLEGWLCLAVVIDLFSRQVVGWAIDRRMKRQLTLDALSMAYWRRKPRDCIQPWGTKPHWHMKKNIAAWRLNKKCPFLLDHYILSSTLKSRAETLVSSCRLFAGIRSHLSSAGRQ